MSKQRHPFGPYPVIAFCFALSLTVTTVLQDFYHHEWWMGVKHFGALWILSGSATFCFGWLNAEFRQKFKADSTPPFIGFLEFVAGGLWVLGGMAFTKVDAVETKTVRRKRGNFLSELGRL